MNKIFWGLLFLFFDININEISILPAFVGYILIYLGMKEYEETPAFAKARPWVIASIVWAVIFWLPLLNPGYLSVIGTALQLLVTYFILQGVEQIEGMQQINLNSSRLRKAWYVTLVCLIAAYLMGLMTAGLAVVAMIAGFIAAIVYIVAFYQCKKTLEQ